MKSFDFYDTLFTRLVATPSGIFRLVEEVCSIPGFATARRRAEVKARRLCPGREVTLAEIYTQLNLAPEDRERARALELQLEQELLAPIACNIDQIAAGDLVISDMYLPPRVLQTVLDRHFAPGLGPKLVVSSETGHRKSDGSLWSRLVKDHRRIVLHIGDNRRSDVTQPRSYGVNVKQFRGAELNRYERRYLTHGLDGDLVAGVSRATRLSARGATGDAASPFPAIDVTFSSVIAPMLVAFVEHVLEECERRGIGRVFFMARDGQLLYRVATKLIHARSLPVEAKYIYGSRHALHLPGFTEVDRAATWLLEDTPILTLVDIARRGEIPLDVLARACAHLGITDTAANIPRRRRADLRQALRDPVVSRALHEASAARWDLAYQYYQQAGITPGSTVALVDVGWTGRMQGSLRSMFDKGGELPVRLIGLYLGLSSKPRVGDSDELQGFLHDPEVIQEACFLDPYRAVLEASLMADHGKTIGFRKEHDVVVPVLDREPSELAVTLVLRQQQTVLRFVDFVLQVEGATGHRVRWPKGTLLRNLRQMLEFPTRCDALAYAHHSLAIGQVEDGEDEVVRLNLKLTDLRRRSRLGLWPEGSLSASGHRALLPLLALARRMKSAREAGRKWLLAQKHVTDAP